MSLNLKYKNYYFYRLIYISSVCFFLTFMSNATAEITLYTQDDKNLDLILDFQLATFINEDAQFGNSRDFLGENTDTWTEFAGEVGIAAEMSLWEGTIFGSWTGVGTRSWDDDASGLSIGTSEENDPSLFKVEQSHIGWKSGTTFKSLDEDAFTLKAGRFDYSIGTGFLINDGSGDGGDRGGWWIGARKVFTDAFLASFDSGDWLVEAFRLKNAPRRGGDQGEAVGGNVEYDLTAANLNLGLTFIQVDRAGTVSEFKNFDTWSFRPTWSPVERLTFTGEYVDQSRNDADGEGWYIQGMYTWPDRKWAPEFSYRYADLSGDDPDTEDDERFRPLAYGFTDYGTWYQGEIAGNYPLENSNLKSHMVRLQMFPKDDITLNLLYYNFTLDERQIFGDPVSDDDFGDEINVSVDWEVNNKTYFIGTYGVLFPGDAAEDYTGGDDDWHYLMLYVNYTF